ncbi:MAG TPA: hypothetical protein PK928_04840 [Candidatus Cloacimonas sp.]|nr:hypothetical protein [Candidatus Cloacimonas sp.]
MNNLSTLHNLHNLRNLRELFPVALVAKYSSNILAYKVNIS